MAGIQAWPSLAKLAAKAKGALPGAEKVAALSKNIAWPLDRRVLWLYKRIKGD
jgi:hypothetical protein